MMRRASRTLIMLIVATALTLSGCSNGFDQPTTTSDSTQKSTPTKKVKSEKIIGDHEPDSVSVLCVDGSAFLYVWEKWGRGGGPSVERFPEQDPTCEGSGTPSPAPSPDGE